MPTRDKQGDVMQPPQAIDDNGQVIGSPSVYIPGVWFSLNTLNGRDAEVAHQTYGFRVSKVELRGDPKRPIKPHHYLQFGSRKLEIASINDLKQNGEDYELLVGER